MTLLRVKCFKLGSFNDTRVSKIYTELLLLYCLKQRERWPVVREYLPIVVTSQNDHEWHCQFWFKHIYLSSIARQVLATYINHFESASWNQPVLVSYEKDMIVTRLGLEPMIPRSRGRQNCLIGNLTHNLSRDITRF
jgi:hypothetical protein